MSGLSGARLLPSAALLLFGSGFCALVYQVVWFRLLRAVFGASTPATAAVTALFMGGLGLGSWLLGRRAERSREPLALYARLELGIALAAGATPWLVAHASRSYFALGGTERLGAAFGTVVQLLLTAAVFGVPTFLMGGTLPAAARAVEAAGDRGRRRLGVLYGANTLGAVAATVVTTLWSLEALGLRASLWTATLLNLVVALLAGLAARSWPAAAVEKSVTETPERAGAASRFVLAAAALTGFTFFLLELVWYRMLAPLLGGSSYTFGLILAVALAGIGAGGLLYGAGSREGRPTPTGFATTCALEALAVAVPFALGDRLALLAAALRDLGATGFDGLVAGWLLVAAIVVLPAAIVAGYQFPLLIGLLGEGAAGVGRDVGRAYGWNTVGAIVGSLAGGFGALPLLGATGAWRLASLVLVLLAGASLVVGRRGAWPGSLLPAAVSLSALACLAAPGPTAFWRHSPIGAGRWSLSHGDPNATYDRMLAQRRTVLWEADGRESSVAAQAVEDYAFLVNGKADGSARNDASTQVLSGLIGAALHPDPRLAFVVGLGTGSTAGWLAEVPGMERVDVVEIEPAILRVAADCAAVNHDVLRHPKVRVRTGDAREVLQTTGERYDVIFSEPSNPYRAGISSLFAQDFYRVVAPRLRPGGLLIQWLQGYEIDAQVVQTTYATMRSVFPIVETWEVGRADLLLIAAQEPILHDLERLHARLDQEPWRTAMHRIWGVDGLEGFYAAFLGTDELARTIAEAEAGRVNTDDLPLLEFGFAKNLGRRGLFRLEDLRRQARAREAALPAEPRAALDAVALADARSARALALVGDLEDPPSGPADLVQRLAARRAYRRGDLGAACRSWSAQSASPRFPIDQLLVAECLADGGDARAPTAIATLSQSRPSDARLVEALAAARRDEWSAASRLLERALEDLEEDPWASVPTLRRALALVGAIAAGDAAGGERLFERLQSPLPVRLLDEMRRGVLLTLARADFASRCGKAFAAAEPWPSWQRDYLALRLDCYRRLDHPRAAAADADWRRFAAAAPPTLPQVAPRAAS